MTEPATVSNRHPRVGWRTALGIIVSLLLIALFAILGWAMASLPRPEETQRAAGLDVPVEVLFDDDAIPYIFAPDLNSAAFALGYAHARDRLWQMEMQRRLAQGRLSELLGPRTVAVDKFYRTLGLYPASEASVAALDAAVRRHLEAYADGVNAWIAERDGALPIELLTLGETPEPWRPADSVVWGKLMALRLSGNFRGELVRARLARALPRAQIEALWPPYPADAPVTIASNRRAAANGTADMPLPAIQAEAGRAAEFDEAVAGIPLAQTGWGASNAWVVDGRRTTTGKPILANDPHLGLSAPILWYLARIETPEGTLTGATVPGVPFVLSGHNGHIAWGLTATESDLQDVVLERLSEGDDTRYDTPDGPRTFAVRRETIEVRGAEAVTVDIRTTRHGPVIDDTPIALDSGGMAVAALQATFLSERDTTAEAIYRLNRARDRDSVRDALRHFVAPQMNITYADTTGGVGFIAPGHVPVRRGGDGFFPSQGWTGAGDWTDIVPYDELPHVFDPPSGVLVNANNPIVGSGYPHFLGRDWDAPFRAERIHELLSEQRGKYELQDAVRMQSDADSRMARLLLPLMLQFEPDAPITRRVFARLSNWKGVMDRDDAEPLIFTAWLRRFNRMLYEDELGAEFESYWDLRPMFIHHVLADGGAAWCDDTRTPATESCAEVLEASFNATVETLAMRDGEDVSRELRWGDVHEARFDHALFRGVPVLRLVANLWIETDGADDTVSRGSTRINDEDEPYAHRHGAGFRGVYDLADLSRSRFVIATGQSGHILSPHYRGMMRLWRDGGFVVLNETRTTLRRSARLRLTLLPG